MPVIAGQMVTIRNTMRRRRKTNEKKQKGMSRVLSILIPSMRQTRNKPKSDVDGDDDEPHTKTIWEDQLPFQPKVFEIYNSMVIQLGVAFLIVTNFVASAIDAQLIPHRGETSYVVLSYFEWFFTVIFTIELAFNFYGHYFWLFWKNPWNWFDFFVVAISLLSLALSDVPGMNVLRLFRAFRVVRLFKRIKSLRLIIDGCMMSIPDVANAFVVLLLLMGIWSIMGVSFYSAKTHPSLETLYAGDEDDDGAFQSHLNFDTFFDAMFTMWAVLTLEGWVNIAMPLIYEIDLASLLFFTSFYFIGCVIMMNVVIAILLENYLEATQAQTRAKRMLEPHAQLSSLEEEIEQCEEYINRLENTLRLVKATSAEDVWPREPELKLKFDWQLVEKRKELASLNKEYVKRLTNIVESQHTEDEAE